MKFLKKFINIYSKSFLDKGECIICNQNIKNYHACLDCDFYNDIRYDIYSNGITLYIKPNIQRIYLCNNEFDFTINKEKIILPYEKEFDNIFELRDYCLDAYNRYEKNLIFFKCKEKCLGHLK